MTLVEVMVCAVIGAIALAVAMKVWVFTAYSFAAMENYSDLDQCSRTALDVMSRDVRQAKELSSWTTNQLVFTDMDGSSFSYTYNPKTGTLVRRWSGQNTILLKDCDYMTFSVSQRNPSNNFSFYPASGPTTAKLIDVAWKCSRRICNEKVNTETMQSAKIVIRN